MTSPSGALLLDKPPGPTSHDVVGSVRRSMGIRRVGHAGTLDPFASGLLIVLVGWATRLSEYLLGLDKTYHATVRFGVETTTHDPEGDVAREDGQWESLDMESINAALAGFRGNILQRPPKYSAKKVGGVSAHRRARRGEDIVLDPVPVNIHELAVTDLALPVCDLVVRCSSGTYIRALARDLGRVLGPGAHLTGLRRTAIGSFSVEDALALESMERGESLADRLLSPARSLAHLPAVEIGEVDAESVSKGRGLAVEENGIPREVPLRILLDGRLVAVGARTGDVIRPRKVFAHA